MLEGFVPVAAASELPPGAMKRVVVGGERTLVVNVGGDFYALRDVCGHAASAPLDGRPRRLRDRVSAALRLLRRSHRQALSGPVSGDVATYQVRVEGDTVYVKR